MGMMKMKTRKTPDWSKSRLADLFPRSHFRPAITQEAWITKIVTTTQESLPRSFGQIYFSKSTVTLVYIEVHQKQKLFLEGFAVDYIWPSL